MSSVAHRLPGRSDLLRVLAGVANDEQALRLAAVLGFEREAAEAVMTETSRRRSTRAAARAEAGRPPDPLRAELLGAVVVDEPDGAPQSTTPTISPLPPLQAADWAAAPDGHANALHVPPIAPRARVVPALGRSLRRPCPGPTDIDRLVQQLARCQLPPALPRRSVTRQVARWMLVLDCRDALRCYARDMALLVRWAEQVYGGQGMAVAELVSADDPLEGWVEVRLRRPHARAGVDAEPRLKRWDELPSETRIVLVSDLGLTAANGNMVPRAWFEWLRGVRAAQASVEVWSPVPLRAHDLPADLAALPVVHWSGHTNLRPVALARGRAQVTPERLRAADDIVARLAAAPWIDPALVRAMRLAAGHADAGLEQLAWTSPHLTRGLNSRRLRLDALDGLRNAFDALPLRVRRQAHELADAHYRSFCQPLAHMQVLTLSAGGAPTVDDARVAEARKFFERLAQHPQASGADAAETRIFLRNWLDHADSEARQALQPLRAQVLSALRQLGDESRRTPAIPSDMPHNLLAQQWASEAAVQPWSLVLDSAAQDLVLRSEGPARHDIDLLGRPMLWASADLQCAGDPQRAWIRLEATDRHALAAVKPGLSLVLRSTGQRVHIAPVARPRGVAAWHRGPDGLSVEGQPLGGQALRAQGASVVLQAPAPADKDQRLRLLVPGVDGAAPGLSFGVDGFGLWAELVLAGVVQRFRWIEPGVFLMGSPKGEAERADHEGPQHEVRLSQGYWLADSACTQALWQAVMGDNPSRFKGDLGLPVEQVSWEDVQRFLGTLQSQLPQGVQAMLPTEAQWEYACRAGTTTPFSLGEQIDPTQVNYEGNFPYDGGAKGEYRSRTVPVKSLPPNQWGLHEMHGNLWEWCADGMRKYTKTPQQDPEGPGGGDRVLRGGSWLFDGWYCRSAFRSASLPGRAFHGLGFRFALRSRAKPGHAEAAERPQGVRAGGARQPSPAEPGRRR